MLEKMWRHLRTPLLFIMTFGAGCHLIGKLGDLEKGSAGDGGSSATRGEGGLGGSGGYGGWGGFGGSPPKAFRSVSFINAET